MDPACGVLKEYVVDPRTGGLYTPDGTYVGQFTGYVEVSPSGGFGKSTRFVAQTDSTPLQVVFPKPGHYVINVTLVDTSGHRHTETRIVTYRPAWAAGWQEVASMPSTPSVKPVKRGAWLEWCEADGMVYAAKGYKTNDFYRYDPVGDSWTQLTGMPYSTHPVWYKKAPRKGSRGSGDGDSTIYVTQGNNSLGFWAYHINTDAWERLEDVPLGPGRKKVKGGTDLRYVVVDRVPYVYLLKGYKTEFYRYDVDAGTWETLPDAPTGSRPKWDKGSWLAANGWACLYAHKAKYHELWRYDLRSDSWSTTPLTGMPFIGSSGRRKKSKDGGSAAWYADGIYALKGGNTVEFWHYDPATDAWTELDTVPSYGTTGRKKRVKHGGDITATEYGAFFALKGNKTLELWRYLLPSAKDGGSGAAAAPSGLGMHALRLVPSVVVGGFTTLHCELPVAGPVRVAVFDVTGRRVLERRSQARPGSGTILDLDVRGLSSGVYLVHLEARGLTATRKLVIQH